MRRTVTVTRFNAECLALIAEIATSGEPLVATKHGYATARTGRASLVTRDERMRGSDLDAQRLVVW
jgi:hypothetical protein